MEVLILFPNILPMIGYEYRNDKTIGYDYHNDCYGIEGFDKSVINNTKAVINNNIISIHNYHSKINSSNNFSHKFMSLNVNGLCSKLKYEDLEDYISKFCIVGLTETKLDDCDHVEFDNFELFTKNCKNFKSRSGGVALLVSSNIVKRVKIVQSDCETALWFHISENLLGYTLFGGVIYIPPDGSKYSYIELFDQIENE